MNTEIPFKLEKIYDRQRDIPRKVQGAGAPADAPFIFLFTGETGKQLRLQGPLD